MCTSIENKKKSIKIYNRSVLLALKHFKRYDRQRKLKEHQCGWLYKNCYIVKLWLATWCVYSIQTSIGFLSHWESNLKFGAGSLFFNHDNSKTRNWTSDDSHCLVSNSGFQSKRFQAKIQFKSVCRLISRIRFLHWWQKVSWNRYLQHIKLTTMCIHIGRPKVIFFLKLATLKGGTQMC